MSVVFALLAAGGARRFGSAKQLVSYRGKPLVRHLVDSVEWASCDARAVVLGARAADVASALEGAPVTLLENEAWEEGIASSVRAATAWAKRRGARALVLALADQPLLDAAHVDRLVDAWKAGALAAASAYLGVLGVPAVFDAQLFPELLRLEGDRGAGRILRGREGVTVISWDEGGVDVDTEADAAALAIRRAAADLC